MTRGVFGHAKEIHVDVEAPLSYGQLYTWREVDSYPPGWQQEANLPATWDLRGSSLDRVQAALRRLCELHEPLRTTYHLRAGVPVQRVHADVALPVERVDRLILSRRVPDRTTTGLVAVPLPVTGALCWRGVLVTMLGAPKFLSLSFSHLIVDVWSIHELEAQFKALLRDPGSAGVAARVGPSPRELARRQRDESGRGRQDSAERYWLAVLGDDQVHQLPTLPAGTQRHRIQATLHSHRLGGLAAQAARRHGVTPPSVLAALVAAGLSEHTSAERVAVSLMASNRFAREYQHVVGTMNQLIPVVIPVDHGASLAEHITRVHWAGAKAYRYSCYDIDRIAALAATAGRPADHDCWFNHLFQSWFNYLQLDDQAADPASRTRAKLAWTPLARQYGQPFDVRVTMRGGLASVALRVDPEVIPADAVTGILRKVALGTQRALTDPQSSLKELRGKHDLPPALYPRR